MRKPPNETARAGDSAHARAQVHPERRAMPPRDELIRLALGPDGEVAPDVRARAPGRGAWIGVDRADARGGAGQGQAEGRARAGVQDRRARRSRRSRRADRGGAAPGGARPARARGARRQSDPRLARRSRPRPGAGQVALLIHAADASEEGGRKLDQAWRVGRERGGQRPRKGWFSRTGRAILSLALGRENVVHVAIIDRAAAARVSHALGRWRAFIGREAGLSAATAETPGASADGCE